MSSVLDSIRDRIATDTEPDSPRTPPMPVADALDILANDRRRIVIDVLARVDDGEITKGHLSELVAGRETHTRPDRLPGAARKRLYVSLHQNILPKLDSAGVIQYDDPDVEVTDRVHALQDAKHALEDSLRGDRA
jgi:hypothetical protein